MLKNQQLSNNGIPTKPKLTFEQDQS